MNADQMVAIVGILMSLALVLTNRRLRHQPLGAKVWMAGVWLVVIIAAAVLFSEFRR